MREKSDRKDLMMEEEVNFSDFLFDAAASLAVKAKDMLDQSDNLSSQDLLNISGVLLNVMEIMTAGHGDGCGCGDEEDLLQD